MWGKSKFDNISRQINELQNKIAHLNNQQMDSNIKATIYSHESQLDQLLNLQEYYWKRRARADWLAEGDINPQFFHRLASRIKRKNFIHGIFSPDNQWISNIHEISSLFQEYFSALYQSSGVDNGIIDRATMGISTRISTDMDSRLDSVFTPDDIKNALFAMNPWKAPGPNGNHAGFFQECWPLLGSSISKLCLNILNDEIIHMWS